MHHLRYVPVIIILYILSILPRFSKRREMKPFLGRPFAHRGYHCQARGVPENSMPAFRAALEKGYGIELDVHLTRDRQLVVFHDHTLDRLCARPGVIEELTCEQLQDYTLGGTNEHIPLLSDVLALVGGQVPLLIELKIKKHPFLISRLAFQMLQNYHGPYLMQSFHTLGLLWYRLYAPDVLRGQLASRLADRSGSEPWLAREAVQTLLANLIGRPDFISYKYSDLPQLSVTLLKHVFRTPIAVWTLRTREAYRKGKAGYAIQIFEKEIIYDDFVKES